jgi:L-seryl-tRNA(Ser) seleniumtransferase
MRLRPGLAAAVGDAFAVTVAACRGQIGSGALPVETIDSRALAIAPRDNHHAGRRLAALARAFRALPIPVIGRIEGGALLLDLRCLEDEAGFLAQLAALRPPGPEAAAP